MIRLQETTVIEAPIQRCFDLARSVEVHLIANVHSGEQALAVGGITSGLVGLGQIDAHAAGGAGGIDQHQRALGGG